MPSLMTKRPNLSKAETEVARILWRRKSASVREIHNEISERRKIDLKTVQTYLRRLEAKGYIKAKLQGRSMVYSVRVKPATVIRQAVAELVDRLFGGESIPLMRHLVEGRNLTVSEIAELRKLIVRLEANNATSRPSQETKP